MKQLLRFVLVGIFNTIFGFSVIFACMYLLGIGPLASNVIGYGCGLLTSYALNKWYTFESAARGAGEPFRFLLVFAAAYLLNLGSLVLLIRHARMHEGIAQLVAGCVYVGASFLLNRYYVFRKTNSV